MRVVRHHRTGTRLRVFGEQHGGLYLLLVPQERVDLYGALRGCHRRRRLLVGTGSLVDLRRDAMQYVIERCHLERRRER